MLRQFFKNALLLLPISFSACGQNTDISHSSTFAEMNKKEPHNMTEHKSEVATFAAGCFWCVEAQFQQLNGVQKVESGFIGGHVANPSYKDVCTGTTGHAEACNITYDPSVISYDELLAAFFTVHDPTQLNRQGNDIGTQYRSAIFYHSPEQQEKANYYIKRLNEEHAYDNPIVTEVQPYSTFYKAEDYHQNYYNQNGEAGYCRMVIKPKLDKFKKVFADKLKN
jgi:peptide-methionine (S)-S-oxide reductase